MSRSESQAGVFGGKAAVSLNQLDALYGPSPTPFFLHHDNRIVYINTAGLKTLGATSSGEVCGRSPFDFIHPDLHALVARRMQQVLEGEGPTPMIEERFVRVDGTVIEAEVTGWQIPYQAGSATAVSFVDITERKRSLRQAEKQAEEQRLALGVSLLGTWSWDARSHTLTFSDRTAEIFGLARPYPSTWDEMRGMLEFRGSEEFVASARRSLELHTDFDLEFQVRRTDGKWIWLATRGTWLRSPDGTPRQLLGVTQDITERKNKEEQIVELNHHLERRVHDFEALLAAMPVAVAVSGESAEDIRMNPAMAGLLNVPVTENISLTSSAAASLPFRILRPDGEEFPVDELPQHVAQREAQPVEDVELLLRRDDGAAFSLRASAVPLFDDSGKVRGTIGAYTDVTAYRRAEEALRVSEERYRSLALASVSLVWILDSIGRGVPGGESQFAAYTGLPPERCAGYGWLSGIHPDDRRQLMAFIDHPSDHSQPRELECRVWHGVTAEWRYCLVRGVPLMRRDGSVREWIGTLTDIQEQKRAQAALLESQQQLRRLVEGSPCGIALGDAGGNITDANSAFLGILGYSREDLQAGLLNWRTLTPQEWLSLDDEAIRALLETGNAPLYEKEYIRKDHSRVPIEIAVTLVPFPGEKNREMFVVFVNDLTERRRAEEALRESKDRLDLATEAGSIGIFDWNMVTGATVWSEKLEELFGLAPGTFGGTVADWRKLCDPLEVLRVMHLIKKAVSAGKQEVSYEFRIVRHGAVRWLGAKARLFYGPKGEPVRMVGVNFDITERKLAEEAIRDANLRLRFHLENTPLAAIEFDPEYRITRWSDRAREIFGWSAEEIVGKKITDLRLVHEDDLAGVIAITTDMQAAALVSNVNVNRNYRKDGSLILCEWYNSALRYDTGELRAVFSLALDITERRKAEDEIARLNSELARSIHELETMFELAPIGLAIARDREGHSIRFNNYVQRVFGTDYRVFLAGELVDAADMPLQRAAREGVEVSETVYRVERSSGAPVDVLCYAAPLREEGGVVWGAVGVFLDMTERLRIENELRRSNTDLSQFAYAVSHDLREPLRMMTAFGQLLKQRYAGDLDEEVSLWLGFVVEGASRMEDLLGDLLIYSRLTVEQSGQPQQGDAAEALEKVLLNLASSISESGAKIRVEGQLPRLPVNNVHLVQLLQNIIGNAVKYRRPEESPDVTLAAVRDGSRWLFSVKDNGIGILPQYRERIFGMFKRLHGREFPGTGIGLALCRRIVESYGGTIWVESEPDQGSTFFFTLPAAD